MRAARLARPLACAGAAAVVAIAMSALAQPPSRTAKRGPPPVATTRPGSAAAVAYLTGHQALVGWHAASSRPVARDGAGRPMLTLTTINRGESLTIPVTGDDGGFSAV